jgi:hypothetical protein
MARIGARRRNFPPCRRGPAGTSALGQAYDDPGASSAGPEGHCRCHQFGSGRMIVRRYVGRGLDLPARMQGAR